MDIRNLSTYIIQPTVELKWMRACPLEPRNRVENATWRCANFSCLCRDIAQTESTKLFPWATSGPCTRIIPNLLCEGMFHCFTLASQ